jgi:hypothetical protein
MRALAFVLAVFLLAPPLHASAVVSGFDSSYAGESAFLTVTLGRTDNFQVFFMNTGTTTWRKGTSTQLNLAVCLENKITCNVPSPHADWNDGGWVSDRVYATQSQDEVRPGEIATFSYNIRPPLTVTAGTYRFNGDLALSDGRQVHPEGYYQDATCSCDRFP